MDPQAQGHGFQGGYAPAGQFPAPGKALCRGGTDAHTGEGTGTVGHGYIGNFPGCLAALLQQILGHDQQGLAVGQAGVLIVVPQQGAVFKQGHRSGLGGGLKGKQEHGRPLLQW